MKKLIVLVGALCTLSCANSPADKIQAMENAYKSTLQVICDNGKGSGTYIGNDTVLTAYHVVDGANEIYIELDGLYVQMKLVKFNENTDLALLKSTHTAVINRPAIKIAKESPVLGDLVYAVGFHFGGPHLKLMNRGIVSQIYDSENDDMDYIFYDAAINPGVSGGCLLNDKYEIIGVNQMIFTTTGAWCGISVSCDTKSLHRFLKD